MSSISTKSSSQSDQYKTPETADRILRQGRPAKLKAVENLLSSDSVEDTNEKNVDFENTARRRSTRKASPNKKYLGEYVCEDSNNNSGRKVNHKRPPDQRYDVADECDGDPEEEVDIYSNVAPKPTKNDLLLLEEDCEVAGRAMFGFNTPKKKDAMQLAVTNTPRTPKMPKTTVIVGKTPETKRRKSAVEEPKTPSYVRSSVKSRIARMARDDSNSDFSDDESEYKPSDESDSYSSSEDNRDGSDADADEPRTPSKGRRSIIVPVLPKTPSAARLKQSTRPKNANDYIPESEDYFQAHCNSKVVTSDHTLDRLKNPRLPADKLFSLLSKMKIPVEHEQSINAMVEEYQSYFPKWMYILNEGFNILLYGLGSKRQLLQSFHHQILEKQPVIVVNGFFPSLTLKDILDSIICEILDISVAPGNPHEAVDMIEEEFSLIPETHLYLIVHNLDGPMLRSTKAQSIISRISKIPNIHLVASIDHINTPLLWDQSKLSNYNFSWWDCTTMLPYTDETAFENSLLVQNSGELALSSMRSVFLSLTTNSRGIYMIVVKYQLKNKSNPTYQGMPFKDLYSNCRESFLVSSDLALRAQLTEFLDHKLVKTKRNVDGSELLTIPIDSVLLQQFLEEQEKK